MGVPRDERPRSGEVPPGHVGDICDVPGLGLPNTLAPRVEGNDTPAESGGQVVGPGAGVHDGSGSPPGVLGYVPPGFAFDLITDSPPDSVAFNTAYECRVQHRLESVGLAAERKQTLLRFTGMYRKMLAELGTTVLVPYSRVKRGFNCFPAGCFIHKYWLPDRDDKPPLWFRCSRALPCPFCRYRTVRDLLDPDSKRFWAFPKQEVTAFFLDYDCQDQEDFAGIRREMGQHVRELRRRIHINAQRLACLNIEHSPDKGYFFRFRQALVTIGDPRVRSRKWECVRGVPYQAIVKGVFRYPESNLEAPVGMFAALFKTGQFKLVTSSRPVS